MNESCDIVVRHQNRVECRSCGAVWDPTNDETSPCETNASGIWPIALTATLATLSAGALLAALAMAGPLATLVRHTLKIGG